MDADKQRQMEAKGWRFGTAEEFLGMVMDKIDRDAMNKRARRFLYEGDRRDYTPTANAVDFAISEIEIDRRGESRTQIAYEAGYKAGLKQGEVNKLRRGAVEVI
jgi:hypothetical protein